MVLGLGRVGPARFCRVHSCLGLQCNPAELSVSDETHAASPARVGPQRRLKGRGHSGSGSFEGRSC